MDVLLLCGYFEPKYQNEITRKTKRAGWKYAKTQTRLFRFMKEQELISNEQYIKSCVIRSGSSLAPNWLREFMFRMILRT